MACPQSRMGWAPGRQQTPAKPVPLPERLSLHSAYPGSENTIPVVSRTQRIPTRQLGAK